MFWHSLRTYLNVPIGRVKYPVVMNVFIQLIILYSYIIIHSKLYIQNSNNYILANGGNAFFSFKRRFLNFLEG